jgi:hypothetical protein
MREDTMGARHSGAGRVKRALAAGAMVIAAFSSLSLSDRAHGQPVGKGSFVQHVHVYSPLVKGYPNPTQSEDQAKLESLLSNPYISGSQLAYDWRHLEPTPGIFRWDIVDADIKPWSDRGKTVWIEIHTANKRPYLQAPRGFPSWITEPPYNVPTVGYYHVDANGDDHTQYPVFWHPTYQQLWANFVSAFAARYDGHPAIEFISISGYSAGTEPRLVAEDNEYYYSDWMAAGLDPGLSLQRVRTFDFYSSSQAAELGTEAVYLNTNLWAIDLFRSNFVRTPLMLNVAKWDLPWQQERYLHAVTQGIGLGSNGLTARVASAFREFSRSIQTTYNVPMAFFEFGPEARTDAGPDGKLGTADDSQVSLLEVYKRGLGMDGRNAYYAPFGRFSYMPVADLNATLGDTVETWNRALRWTDRRTLSHLP